MNPKLGKDKKHFSLQGHLQLSAPKLKNINIKTWKSGFYLSKRGM